MSEKPEWTQVLGKQYAEGKPMGINTHTELKCAYDVMLYRNRELFEEIPIPVEFQKEDPYSNYTDMKDTVSVEGILRIFSGGDTPTYLSKEQNLIGRAVHDYYGHLGFDVPFTPKGEFYKWLHMSQFYHPCVVQLLFAEVVYQVAAVHYVHGFNYQQRSVLADSKHIEMVCQYYGETVPEGVYYW